MQKQPNYIDVFAGCGGIDVGLYQAGWKGLFAVEKNDEAFQTLQHNLIEKCGHFSWPTWLPQRAWDINEVISNFRQRLVGLRGKVDLVVGGPPCQGFSMAGRRREDDYRNQLIKSYLEFVSLVQPKVIFFENVRGFNQQFHKNKSEGIGYGSFVREKLEELGYDVNGQLVDFSRFGVPQKRTRFILVGIQTAIAAKSGVNPADFFSRLDENRMGFFGEKGLGNGQITLEQAISDLLKKHGQTDTPDRRGGFQSGKYGGTDSHFQQLMRVGALSERTPDSHSFAKHHPHIVRRFADILASSERNKAIGHQFKEKYGITKQTTIPLDAASPAPTLTTLPDDFIHYSEPRIMTPREYARIQTFPDWFEFKGKYTTGGDRRTLETPRYTQIGNAVPPLFGEQSGLAIKQLLRHG